MSVHAALFTVLTASCLSDPAQYVGGGTTSADGAGGVGGNPTGGAGSTGGSSAGGTTASGGAGAGGEGGQATAPLWVVTLGTAGDQSFDAVAVSTDGNVYAGGRWEGGEFNIDVLGGGCVSGAAAPAFVHAVTSDGTPLWTRCLGDDSTIAGIDVNGSGNIAVAGTFRDKINVGGGVITAQGEMDVFVVVLAPNGDIVGGTTFGSTARDEAHSVAHSPAGDVFVSGSFRGPMTIGSTLLQPTSGAGIFTAKFVGEDAVWAHAIHTTGPEPTLKLAIQQNAEGKLIAAGAFTGSIDADAASPGLPVDAFDLEPDVFTFTLESDGSLTSFRTYPTAGKQEIGGVGASATRAVVSGTAATAIDFEGSGPWPENAVEGEVAAFLLGMNFDHQPTNLFVVDGGGTQVGLAAALPPDTVGPMLLAGLFTGATTLGGNALNTPAGASDGFFMLHSPGMSAPTATQSLGGAGPQSVRGAAFLGDDVIVVGGFADILDLGPNPPSALAMDAFIARFSL